KVLWSAIQADDVAEAGTVIPKVYRPMLYGRHAQAEYQSRHLVHGRSRRYDVNWGCARLSKYPCRRMIYVLQALQRQLLEERLRLDQSRIVPYVQGATRMQNHLPNCIDTTG